MEASNEKQIIYELGFLLRVGESESIIDSALAAVSATVVNKGAVTQVQLAYPIAKQGNAMFGFVQFTVSASDAIKTISESLRHKEQVIRFLFTKVPKKKPTSAPKAKIAEGTEPEKKTVVMTTVGNIDSLSNEKLEETLEEILK